MVRVNRPCSAGDFAGDDYQGCCRAPTLGAVMLVEGFPDLGLGRRHCCVKQQAAQFAGAAFGPASATDCVAGIIRSGVEAGECNERLRISEGKPFQRIGRRHAHHGANAHNGLQTLLRFLVLRRAGCNR